MTSTKIADNTLSLSSIQRQGTTVLVDPNSFGTATAACDPGETSVSGGFDSGGAASANNIFLEGNSFNLGVWEVMIFNDDDTNMAQLFATVVCISPLP